MFKPRLAAQDAKQMLALLSRRDGVARPANRQHAIVAALVVKAIGEILGQIIVADGLAGRNSAFSKASLAC